MEKFEYKNVMELEVGEENGKVEFVESKENSIDEYDFFEFMEGCNVNSRKLLKEVLLVEENESEVDYLVKYCKDESKREFIKEKMDLIISYIKNKEYIVRVYNKKENVCIVVLNKEIWKELKKKD